MIRGHDPGGPTRLVELSATARNSELWTDERLRGGRSKTHDHTRFHDGQLRFKPRTTGLDLVRSRRLVNAPFAPRFPLEMLHDVRDVNAAPIESDLRERAVEHLARRTHERRALQI